MPQYLWQNKIIPIKLEPLQLRIQSCEQFRERQKNPENCPNTLENRYTDKTDFLHIRCHRLCELVLCCGSRKIELCVRVCMF